MNSKKNTLFYRVSGNKLSGRFTNKRTFLEIRSNTKDLSIFIKHLDG